MNLGGFHALSHWWLAGLLAPLILFYFLKLKRPRFQVPSLALWQQALQDQRVNSPFQKFKRNLLLLLQLLLLILLILAALQPFWRGSADRTKRLPILVDCSASMAALDKPNGVTRLAEAKRRVREMIDGLSGDQQLCLISFSRAAHKRIGFTNNKRLLRDALDQIEIENVSSDLEEALRLTQALARSEPFDEVLLFSDGNLPGRVHFDLSFKLNYQRLAAAGANVGITGFSAQRSVDGGWDVLVQVEGSERAEGNATLALTQDSASVGSERITYAKGRAQRLVFRVNGEKASTLRAHLTVDDFDSLASDNAAQMDLPASRQLRVFVPKSLATYRRAFNGMTGIILLPQETGDEAAGQFDLVISDRPQDAAMASRARLLVGIVPDSLQKLISIETNGTRVVDWRRDAPLLQHVQLGDLVVLDRPEYLGKASEGDLENLGYEVLVHGNRGPLLVRKQTAEQLELAMLFHSDHSTLPYRVGFPIFVANVVQAALQHAGLAEIRGSHSLLSPSETSLAAVDRLEFNERLAVSTASVPIKTDKALWPLLVMLALVALMVEWWFYQRKPGGWGR